MSAPYRVHVVDAVRGLDGLLMPTTTLLGIYSTREAAQRAAAQLIRDGTCRSTEVRQRTLLLDSFVLRGERTPAHVYRHVTRAVQRTLEV
jgi:hypothetical protein